MTFQRVDRKQRVDWRQVFWYRVSPNDENGCWEWTGPSTPHGYGTQSSGTKEQRAHRLSYQMFFGDIPDGLWILHKCDNRRCVNPAHLYAGTPMDNVVDRRERKRFVCNKQKRIRETGKCMKGLHDWTPENIRRTKQGRNLCLACNRAIKRKHHLLEWEREKAARKHLPTP